MIKNTLLILFILASALAGRSQNLESVVPYIRSMGGNGKEMETGAGIIVGNEKGKVFILTAFHVVEESKEIKVEFRQGWREYQGRLYSKIQKEMDIAVIEVTVPLGELKFVPIQVGEVKNLLQGQGVLSIGHPVGSKWLRNTQNKILSTEYDFDPRRISMEKNGINPGCSGGPIFKDGDLIGMVTETSGVEVLGIKADLFTRILKAWQIPTNLLVNKEKEEEPLTLEWWNSLSHIWQLILSGRGGYYNPSAYSDPWGASYGKEFIEFGEAPTPENLRMLSKTTRIKCDGTDIKSLAPLSRLRNLEKINCFGCRVQSLQPLSELSKLRILYCGGTNISSVLPLKNLTNLEELSIDRNIFLESLEGLGELRHLKKLDCSHSSSITSLDPLKKLVNLEELDINGCDKLTNDAWNVLDGLVSLKVLKIGQEEWIDSKSLELFRSKHKDCKIE